MDEIATWKRSSAGPYLYVCGVKVASFLGTMYDERCEQLCAEINRAYAERTADSGGEVKPCFTNDAGAEPHDGAHAHGRHLASASGAKVDA